MKRTTGIIIFVLLPAVPIAFLCGTQFEQYRSAFHPQDEPRETSVDDERVPPVLPGDKAARVQVDVTGLFTPEAVESIRSKPERCAALFDRFERGSMWQEVGWLKNLSREERGAVFCCILSYAMAPYANSVARDFDKLLKEKQLDCDNYVLLARYFFDLLRRERQLPDLTFEYVGWDGEAVGNHAQMFVRKKERSILLDPTVCLIARCEFDRVTAGYRVPLAHIIDFAWRKEMFWYGDKVATSLNYGRYRPSDLFYYYVDFERFAHGPASYERFETPGAVRVRKRIREIAAKKTTADSQRQ